MGVDSLYPRVAFLNDSLESLLGLFHDFTNKAELGFEAEIMTSLSDKIWLGLEISRDAMTGKNDYPGFYNFQYTNSLQLQSTDTISKVITPWQTCLPIKYSTSMVNIVGNFRIYPIPEGKIRPFIKVSTGISLISTELSLSTPAEWTDKVKTIPNAVPGPPVLYSRGKKDSEKKVMPAFNIGGGIGFELQLTEKISLYADATYRMVNSNILDGIPNYDYIEKTGRLKEYNTWATTRKISFGLVYTLGEGYSVFGNGGNKGKGTAKRHHPFLPFYEVKPF